MTRTACPHCGFLNFSISAYCGRCERPIKTDTTPHPRAAEQKPEPATPPHAAPEERATEPPMDKNATVAVPPPVPPPRTDVTPAPLPIELKLPEPEQPRDAVAEGQAAVAAGLEARATARAQGSTEARAETVLSGPAQEPPPPPLSTEVPPDVSDLEGVDVPVAVASGYRLFIAWTVDAGLVLAFGGAVAGLEALLFGGGPFSAMTPHLLDVAADWLATYSGAALHGSIAAVLFGAGYTLYAGRRGGRTIGRRLTGTVLIRTSGRRLGWPLIIVRTVAGLFSFALFGAGFFWSIVDAKHRTWHDLLAGTIVVRRRVRIPPGPA